VNAEHRGPEDRPMSTDPTGTEPFADSTLDRVQPATEGA
jgi:hypothetical protein